MPEYLVNAVDNPHGKIHLGKHNASNPENAARRAREDYTPDNQLETVALAKAEEFEIHKVEETNKIKWN